MIIRTLVLLLIVATTAAAQPRWEFLETWGSATYKVFVMPDSTLVADTEIGIVTSSNGGEEWTLTWKHQPHSTPWPTFRMSLAAVNPKTGTLIARTNDSIYFSTDRGRSWTSTSVDPMNAALFLRGVAVTRNGTFYLNFYEPFQQEERVAGLLRSDDDGRTWSRAGLSGIKVDRVLALDEQSLIAATSNYPGIGKHESKGELRISTDRGISWSEGKPFPWPNKSRYSNLIDIQLDSTGALWALTRGGLWRSTDTGTSWTPHLNNSIDILVSMTVTPGGVLLVGTIKGSIWHSNNSGSTWSNVVSTPSHIGPLAYQLVALPEGGLFRLQYTSAGILYSSDKGRTWTRRNSGIPTIAYTLSAGRGRVVAGLDRETRISNDGGKSWQVHQHLRNSWQRSTVTGSGTFLISTDSVLERSTDGGVTWTRTDGNPPFSDFADNGAGDLFSLVLETHPSRYYYCISHDDGITWNCLPPDPSLASTPVAVFDGRNAAYIPTHGIRVSLDNGVTWSVCYPEFAFALTVDHHGSVIAMTNLGVIRSDDRGTTWSIVADPTIFFTSMVTAPDGSIIGGTRGQGIWRSVNRGENWMPFSNGLTHDYISALAVDRSTGVVYAGTEFGGLFRLVDAGW